MPGQSSPAFLSVRLPQATRDRLKAATAARGQTVQGLVDSLVERFLAEETRQAPDLATVLRTLRAQAESLKQRGVIGLWVFGSVARGDARADSDVDLLAEFTPGAHLSLVGLTSLRAELSDPLGASADLVERSALRPTCAKQPNARRCGCYETAWHARAAEGHPGRGRGRAGFRGRAGRGGLPRCRRLIGGPIARSRTHLPRSARR